MSSFKEAGGLRGRADHGSGGHVSEPAQSGPHLPQPGPALGARAPGLLPVRAVGRRRCLHSRVLRPGVDGRGGGTGKSWSSAPQR